MTFHPELPPVPADRSVTGQDGSWAGNRGSLVAVAAAAVLVCGTAAAGWWLSRRGFDLILGSAYPLTGHYRLHVTGGLAVVVLAAATVVGSGPRVAAGLPWRELLVVSWLASAGWAVSLALVGGVAAVTAPLASPHEYLFEVERIDEIGVATFLRTFVWYVPEGSQGPAWTTHVAGHPPLATLVFVLLARAGLPGPGWAAALCIAAGASAAPSVLATLRRVAGEVLARRAAPFVAAAPVALWIATSADALFAGVAAGAICALAHAVGARYGRRGVLAAAGGAALGGCLMLSYGLTLLAPIALAAVLAAAVRTEPAGPARWRRLAGVLAVAGCGVAAVLAGFAVAGFWWLDGWAVTMPRVVDNDGWRGRPTAYFVFANLAAVAVAVGPAVVAALPALARRLTAAVRAGPGAWGPTGAGSAWLGLPAAALLAVVLATASSLSKGEVERIYLPFAVWLLPLAALLRGRGDHSEATASEHRGERQRVRSGANAEPSRDDHGGAPARGWLAASVGWAVLLAATTQLKW